jgi:hypothetical protein
MFLLYRTSLISVALTFCFFSAPAQFPMLQV